ncbi:uncharacterized protein LOC131613967 [Vicia villosa]|uniref:uncharacterized protein LOC131613967 n=1 Tax=Vicia villosa TaxID=3911 RepID=UPI00273C1503|nr:uncharacterized protein LOC131613967 [Vicia villosa]
MRLNGTQEFTKRLCNCSSVVADLWGIFEGIRMVQSKGIKKVEVQTDSKEIYNALIQEAKLGSTYDFTPTYHKEASKSVRVSHCSCHHVYREENCGANSLPKMGSSNRIGSAYFDNCP